MPVTGSGWSLSGIPKLTSQARYVDDEENDEESRGATPLSLFSVSLPLFCFRFSLVSVAVLSWRLQLTNYSLDRPVQGEFTFYSKTRVSLTVTSSASAA